ncbi:MAG: hypothetical protein JSU66_06890 [Deltaproteobacteria bacterium]|nr:MAG: hypothetical protein JSU66_06890 [Deltaproteobacteria bacterium]
MLGLTPVARRPQVVGSTLHIGMGPLEVAALRATRRGALRLSLRWPGAQRGTIWIAAAGARDARPLAVRFEDAADLDVAP